MKTNKNEPMPSNDIRRTGEPNREDNTRPQERTKGPNEMTTGSPRSKERNATSKDQKTDSNTMRTNPNSEDVIGENAGGNFPTNNETPEERSKT